MHKILMLMFVFMSSQICANDLQSTRFDYPELMVTPKASERLAREAKQESSNAWTSHLPVQASALVTLYAASSAMGDKSNASSDTKAKEDEDSSAAAGQVGMLVGAGWITTTVVMSAMYRPYKSCSTTLPKADPKSKESILARERAAEECLQAPARIGSRIALLSASSNFAAGAYIAAVAKEDMNKVMGSLAALAAFAPYLFSYHWEDVAEYHEDYKRRIYGPVTEIGITPVALAQGVVPGLGFSYRF